MYNDGMSLISVILSAIVLAWLDNYLRRQSKLHISPNESGSIVLRMNAINERLGWYALAMAFLFAIGAIFYTGSLQETVTTSAVAVATGLGGVLLIAYCRNTIIKIDDEKVESQDIFGKTTTLRWDEVTAVSKQERVRCGVFCRLRRRLGLFAAFSLALQIGGSAKGADSGTESYSRILVTA